MKKKIKYLLLILITSLIILIGFISFTSYEKEKSISEFKSYLSQYKIEAQNYITEKNIKKYNRLISKSERVIAEELYGEIYETLSELEDFKNINKLIGGYVYNKVLTEYKNTANGLYILLEVTDIINDELDVYFLFGNYSEGGATGGEALDGKGTLYKRDDNMYSGMIYSKSDRDALFTIEVNINEDTALLNVSETNLFQFPKDIEMKKTKNYYKP